MRRRIAKVGLTAPWLVILGVFVTFCMLASGVAITLDLRAEAWRAAEKSPRTLVLALARDLARSITLYDLSLQGIRQIMEQPDINRLIPTALDIDRCPGSHTN